MTKILVKFWLNHPDRFKPICWIFGHKWYEISTPKDGGKIVTRRVIMNIPEKWHRGYTAFENNPNGDEEFIIYGDCGTKTIRARYNVGDLLWLKEGWRCTGGGSERNIIYKADGDTPMSFCGVDDARKSILRVAEPYWAEWDRLVYETDKGCNWRSPRSMPKWVARTWLEVVSVRVEQSDDGIWVWRYEFKEYPVIVNSQ